jgi:hypothetical protein
MVILGYPRVFLLTCGIYDLKQCIPTIPILIWIDRLDCVRKNVHIKAKNVDGVLLPTRLFNVDMYIFNSKISVKSISDWYTKK